MVVVKKYHFPPTPLIPNSPHPLLHYEGVLLDPSFVGKAEDDCSPERVYDLFVGNGWQPQWIFRYGPTQSSHYHSETHECMAVLTGSATIRFGVADVGDDSDSDKNGQEPGGIELHARAGDVFVLPAGTAHKTFQTQPEAEFALLTPGDGHNVAADDVRGALANVALSGFTMLGAYPADPGNGAWDFAVGGESEGAYQRVWDVKKPAKDPVVGTASEGVCGQW